MSSNTNALNLFCQAMQAVPAMPLTTGTTQLVDTSPCISRASSGTGIGADDALLTTTNSGSFGGNIGDPLPPSPTTTPFPALAHGIRGPGDDLSPNSSTGSMPLHISPIAYQQQPSAVQYMPAMIPIQPTGNHQTHHLFPKHQQQTQQFVQVVPQVGAPMQMMQQQQQQHGVPQPPMYQHGVMHPQQHLPFPGLRQPATVASNGPAPATDFGAQWRKKHGSKKVART